MATEDKVILRDYYSRLFPRAVNALCNLVTFNGKFPLNSVELVPRWEIKGAGTVMNRDCVFYSCTDLVTYCKQKTPHSLQASGVLPCRGGVSKDARKRDRHSISQRTGSVFGPLVIDIDIHDYDRTGLCPCGAEKKLCQVCYSVIILAARLVMRYWLCNVFGFTGVFEVFSGQKGIHIWVCCERAFLMTEAQRTTLLQRIQCPIEHDGHIDEIYKEILRPIFEDTPALLEKDRTCSKHSVLYWLYPRIDLDVGKDAYHLKKLPLLPHQKSQFVSIPLPPLDVCRQVLLSQIQVRSTDLDADAFYSLYVTQVESALSEVRGRIQ